MYFEFCMILSNHKLATMDPYGISDRYPSHITVLDNTDEAWGTSSIIKDNDGVSVPPLHIFLWFYLSFF